MTKRDVLKEAADRIESYVIESKRAFDDSNDNGIPFVMEVILREWHVQDNSVWDVIHQTDKVQAMLKRRGIVTLPLGGEGLVFLGLKDQEYRLEDDEHGKCCVEVGPKSEKSETEKIKAAIADLEHHEIPGFIPERIYWIENRWVKSRRNTGCTAPTTTYTRKEFLAMYQGILAERSRIEKEVEADRKAAE